MPSQYDPQTKSRNDQMVDTSYSQAELDEIYTRSVNSFFCPVCSMGRCRVVIESQSKPFEEWLYECDRCQITGTKHFIKRVRFCSVCGRALNVWNNCPSGCVDNKVAEAVIATSAPLIKTWELLKLARLAEQKQWYSGQSVWIVPGKAFLKEYDGYVNLHVVGNEHSLPVFVFSPMTGWVEVVGLDREFAKWLKGE